MSRRTILQISGFVVVIILLALNLVDTQPSAALQSPYPIALQSYVFEARTNENGRAEIEHGLNIGCETETDIYGMTAAVQNVSNGAWYTVHVSPTPNDFALRMAWDDVKAGIHIENPSYFESPVKIILFVGPKLC